MIHNQSEAFKKYCSSTHNFNQLSSNHINTFKHIPCPSQDHCKVPCSEKRR